MKKDCRLESCWVLYYLKENLATRFQKHEPIERKPNKLRRPHQISCKQIISSYKTQIKIVSKLYSGCSTTAERMPLTQRDLVQIPPGAGLFLFLTLSLALCP